ncbi:hypothetical protein RE628_05560 [Paenibacillus sp. D2_2]|uniref:hypothetical protein n=1 Tax=Paenibacillus sp. D2_2 TaxID=3073092 RepID=UPI002815DCEF|nr:hypothetical protein [Paenibacillus sp. D2_2]WMT41910.1 hypothetical protein RE628_05560 [Paenibacillus sp. D2_2]
MRIMIVDDETFIRVNFKTFLDWKQEGYDLVGEAANGEEALKRSKNFNLMSYFSTFGCRYSTDLACFGS